MGQSTLVLVAVSFMSFAGQGYARSVSAQSQDSLSLTSRWPSGGDDDDSGPDAGDGRWPSGGAADDCQCPGGCDSGQTPPSAPIGQTSPEGQK